MVGEAKVIMARWTMLESFLPEQMTWDKVEISLLLEIREELRTLNRLLACHRFTNIPSTLLAIERNTKKPKRKKR